MQTKRVCIPKIKYMCTVFLALTTLTYTDEKFKFLGAKISFKDEYDIWYIHVYEI